MSNSKMFSLADFANYSRVSRDALCHYDRIGLLSPAHRGTNKYRYYSSSQLPVVNMIRSFQQLGFSLSEIKELRDNRTPEEVHGILLNQTDKIDAIIDDWTSSRRLSSTLQRNIYSAMGIDEDIISVNRLPSEAIILGDVNDYRNNNDDYDALHAFYDSLSKKYPGLNLNYPVWAMYSQEQIENRNWFNPDRYYFCNPLGLERRAAALFAIGYRRCGYGQCEELYERMIEYISTNGYEICGGTYEEYPLNEVCVKDPNNYLVRVLMSVRKI